MALLFLDSFDHYSTSDVQKKYDAANGVSIIDTDFRNGTQCASFSSDAGNHLTKKFENHATWIIGVGIKTIGTISGSSDFDIFEVIDDLVSTTTESHVSFQYTGAKKFRIVRGNDVSAFQLAISDNTFDIDDGWHFVEFKVLIHPSAGTIDAKFDGTAIDGLSATGLDTQKGANAFANRISLRPVVTGAITACQYDDYYIMNGATPGATDMLGDMKVDALFPKADGNYEEFTPSTGTDAFALLNINPPDDDTSYVESNVASEKSSFDMDEAGNFTIHGVQHVLDIRKVGSNARKVKHLTRVSGNDHRGSSIRMGESFNMKTKMWETNPKNGSPWIASEVNGAEFGMEVI